MMPPERFLRLVGEGKLDQVRTALQTAPDLVNAVGPHPFWGGRPQPLHVAIETMRDGMIRLLLDAGADVNGSNSEYDYWSPLMISIQRNAVTEELLRRGARVGLVEALMLADDRRVAELAVALPDTVPNGGSILAFARTTFAIDRLLELGASIDAKDRWGGTPVTAMSRLGARGHALVTHLTARGAAVAPEECARLGDEETLAVLLGAEPAIASRPGVLFAAADHGHHALAAWLLSKGASANARSIEGSRHTVLHAAAWNGDLEMVKLLVKAGADRGARDEEHNGTARDWADAAIQIRNRPECRQVVEYFDEL